jgi:hypothetical protein
MGDCVRVLEQPSSEDEPLLVGEKAHPALNLTLHPADGVVELDLQSDGPPRRCLDMDLLGWSALLLLRADVGAIPSEVYLARILRSPTPSRSLLTGVEHIALLLRSGRIDRLRRSLFLKKTS